MHSRMILRAMVARTLEMQTWGPPNPIVYSEVKNTFLFDDDCITPARRKQELQVIDRDYQALKRELKSVEHLDTVGEVLGPIDDPQYMTSHPDGDYKVFVGLETFLLHHCNSKARVRATTRSHNRLDSKSLKQLAKTRVEHTQNRVLNDFATCVAELVAETGEVTVWQDTTTEERREMFTKYYDQQPWIICRRIFKKSWPEVNIDGIFGVDDKLEQVQPWRTFLREMFLDAAEMTYLCCVMPSNRSNDFKIYRRHQWKFLTTLPGCTKYRHLGLAVDDIPVDTKAFRKDESHDIVPLPSTSAKNDARRPRSVRSDGKGYHGEGEIDDEPPLTFYERIEEVSERVRRVVERYYDVQAGTSPEQLEKAEINRSKGYRRALAPRPHRNPSKRMRGEKEGSVGEPLWKRVRVG